MTGQDRFIDIGLTLHVCEWPGDKIPFVLLHGLSSNCRTWEAVAGRLAAAGHRIITVDQRGHGLSDKPDNGYDFATITADLARLLPVLSLEQPIIVGQSWGGNVVLEFGVRYPGLARGLGLVDGGFIDHQARPNGDWESVSTELRPADLDGLPRTELENRIRESHPDWSDEGIEVMLANFETLADGTIRRWLAIPNHMKILRAMWEQRPLELYPQVTAPVLICAADSSDAWSEYKRKLVAAAQAGLPRVEVHWFPATDHDIHIQRPDALAELFLQVVESGIWRA
jgi:pimeloyl-ACP methyl ester carboxylesterase